MIRRIIIAAIAVGGVAASTSAESIGILGSSLFLMVQHFYEARMERAQMRLAPIGRTRKIDAADEKNRCS
jgi:hypothetical protein